MISSKIITPEESNKLKAQLEDIFKQDKYNDALVEQFLKDTSKRKPPLIFLTYEEKLDYLKRIVEKGDPQFLKIFSGNNIGLRYFTSEDLEDIIKEDIKDEDKKKQMHKDGWSLIVTNSDVDRQIIKEIVKNIKEYTGANSKSLSHGCMLDENVRNSDCKRMLQYQNFSPNHMHLNEVYCTPPTGFLEFIYIPPVLPRNPIREEYVKQMIEIGAHVNFIGCHLHNDMTPIAIASLEDKYSTSMLKLLLDYGADPNIRREKDGEASSVFYNERYGHIKNTKKIDILLLAGAKPNATELQENDILKARYEQYQKDGFKSERLRENRNLMIGAIIIFAISALALSYKYTSFGSKLKEVIQKFRKIKLNSSTKIANAIVDTKITSKSRQI